MTPPTDTLEPIAPPSPDELDAILAQRAAAAPPAQPTQPAPDVRPATVRTSTPSPDELDSILRSRGATIKPESLTLPADVASRVDASHPIVFKALKDLGKYSYDWGANGDNGKFDCSSWTQHVFNSLGISIPRSAAEQHDSSQPVNAGQQKPGDLVFLHNTGGRSGITHVGIYAGNNQYTHMSSGSNSVILDRLDSNYNKAHQPTFRRPGGSQELSSNIDVKPLQPLPVIQKATPTKRVAGTTKRVVETAAPGEMGSFLFGSERSAGEEAFEKLLPEDKRLKHGEYRMPVASKKVEVINYGGPRDADPRGMEKGPKFSSSGPKDEIKAVVLAGVSGLPELLEMVERVHPTWNRQAVIRTYNLLNVTSADKDRLDKNPNGYALVRELIERRMEKGRATTATAGGASPESTRPALKWREEQDRVRFQGALRGVPEGLVQGVTFGVVNPNWGGSAEGRLVGNALSLLVGGEIAAAKVAEGWVLKAGAKSGNVVMKIAGKTFFESAEEASRALQNAKAALYTKEAVRAARLASETKSIGKAVVKIGGLSLLPAKMVLKSPETVVYALEAVPRIAKTTKLKNVGVTAEVAAGQGLLNDDFSQRGAEGYGEIARNAIQNGLLSMVRDDALARRDVATAVKAETQMRSMPQPEGTIAAAGYNVLQGDWWEAMLGDGGKALFATSVENVMRNMPWMAAGQMASLGVAKEGLGKFARAAAISSSVGEGQMEYQAALADFMGQKGVDLADSKQITAFLDNPDAMHQAQIYATKRGIAVPLGGLPLEMMGGGILENALKAPGRGIKRVARVTGGLLGDTAVNTLGQSGGEGFGKLMTGADITDPQQLTDIVMEGLVAGPQGAATTAGHLAANAAISQTRQIESPWAKKKQGAPVFTSDPRPQTTQAEDGSVTVTWDGVESPHVYESVDKAIADRDSATWKEAKLKRFIKETPALAHVGVQTDSNGKLTLHAEGGAITGLSILSDADMDALQEANPETWQESVSASGAADGSVKKAFGAYVEATDEAPGHIYLRENSAIGDLTHEGVHWFVNAGIISTEDVKKVGRWARKTYDIDANATDNEAFAYAAGDKSNRAAKAPTGIRAIIGRIAEFIHIMTSKEYRQVRPILEDVQSGRMQARTPQFTNEQVRESAPETANPADQATPSPEATQDTQTTQSMSEPVATPEAVAEPVIPPTVAQTPEFKTPSSQRVQVEQVYRKAVNDIAREAKAETADIHQQIADLEEHKDHIVKNTPDRADELVPELDSRIDSLRQAAEKVQDTKRSALDGARSHRDDQLTQAKATEDWSAAEANTDLQGRRSGAVEEIAGIDEELGRLDRGRRTAKAADRILELQQRRAEVEAQIDAIDRAKESPLFAARAAEEKVSEGVVNTEAQAYNGQTVATTMPIARASATSEGSKRSISSEVRSDDTRAGAMATASPSVAPEMTQGEAGARRLKNLGLNILPLGDAVQFAIREVDRQAPDYETNEFWSVNLHMSKELRFVEKFMGGPHPDARVLGKAKDGTIIRTLDPGVMMQHIYDYVSSGKLDWILDPKTSYAEIARKLGVPCNKTFRAEVKALRSRSDSWSDYYDEDLDEQGNPIPNTEERKTVGKRPEKLIWGDNGKAGVSIDFPIATCNPTESCKVCYAAKAFNRTSQINKMMRNLVWIIKDPEGFGRTAAYELRAIPQENEIFARLLGAGDLNSDEMIQAFNTLAKYADRPIQIFSRNHKMLQELKFTQNAPFIKMGSIDAQLYKEYGAENLRKNFSDHGIANAWLYTDESEIPAMLDLMNSDALKLVLSSSLPLHMSLVRGAKDPGLVKMQIALAPEELRTRLADMSDDDIKNALTQLVASSCPCDAHIRSYFNSCRQCAMANLGCMMAFADVGVDVDGKTWKLDDPNAPDDVKAILAWTKRGAEFMHEVYANVAKEIIQKSRELVMLNKRGFKDGSKQFISLKDIRNPKLIYTTDSIPVAEAYLENLTQIKDMADKSGIFWLPGNEAAPGAASEGFGKRVMKITSRTGKKDADIRALTTADFPEGAIPAKSKLDPRVVNALESAGMDPDELTKKELRDFIEEITGEPQSAKRTAKKKTGTPVVRTDQTDQTDQKGSRKVHFAAREDAEASFDPSLVALHNTDAAGILHAAEFGGIPVPSMAVVPAGQEFESFGNITLMGDRSMVDPAIRGNKTFAADVYSPRQPNASYSVNKPVVNEFYALVKKLNDPKDAGTTDYIMPAFDPASNGAKDPERWVRDLTDDPQMQILYARSHGIELDLPRYDDFVVEKDDPSRGVDNATVKQLMDFFDARRQALKGTTFVKEDYVGWLKGLAHRMFTKPYLKRNGKKLPYNLDNVAAAMSGATRAQETGFGGSLGGQRAKVAKQFTSLKQMHDAKGKIITNEEFADWRENHRGRVAQLVSDLMPFYDDGGGETDAFRRWDGSSTWVNDALGRYMKSGKGESAMRAILNDNLRVKTMTIPAGLVRDAVRLAEELRDAPTEYFESKPQRGIRLSEFKAAVVPVGTGMDVRKALIDAGLELRFYEPYWESRNEPVPQESRKGQVEDIARRRVDEGILFTARALPDAEYFDNPDEDRVLPSLPDAVVSMIGKEQKPLLLKKVIVEKNHENHAELAPDENAKILQAALYNPTKIIQDRPTDKPALWMLVRENGKASVTVVELADHKDTHQIVGWRYARTPDIARMERRAEREGGQVLIPPANRSAADLPAIPSSTTDNYTTDGKARNDTGTKFSARAEEPVRGPRVPLHEAGFPSPQVSDPKKPGPYVGSMNTSKLDVGDAENSDEIITAVVNAMREQVETNNNQVQDQRRGVRTWEETENAATLLAMGLDPKKLSRLKKGKALNAEEQEAATMVFLGLMEKVREAQGRYNATGELEDQAKFYQALEEWKAVHFALQGARAEAGRALNILKKSKKAIALAGNRKDLLMAHLIEMQGTINTDMAEIIAGIDPNDTMALYKVMTDVAKTKMQIGHKFHALLYANQLSSLAAHAANTLGNLVNITVNEMLVNPTAAGIDSARAWMTGKERTLYHIPVLKTALNRHAYVESLQLMGKALKASQKAAKYGFSERAANRFDIPHNFREFSDIRALGKDFIHPLNYSFRGLSAEDQFYRTIAEARTVNQEALTLAVNKLKRTKGKGNFSPLDVMEEVMTIKQNLMEYPEIMDKAEEYGDYILMSRKGGKVMQKTAEWINSDWGKGFSPLKVVVPYFTVPANITKAGLEWNVTGVLKAGNKSLTIDEREKALSRAILGTLFLTGIYFAVSAGAIGIVGEPEKKKGIRMLEEMAGRKGWSFNIRGHYLPFESVQFIGPGLSAVAAIIENHAKGEKGSDEVPASSDLMVAGRALWKSVQDQSFMQGMDTMLKLFADVGDDDTSDSASDRFFGNLATSMMPFSGLTGNFANATDTVRRDVESDNFGKELVNRMKVKLPGLRKTLPPVIGPLGDPLPQRPTGISAFSRSIGWDEIDAGPVVEELLRLKFSPSMVSDRFVADDKSYKLTPDEHRAYKEKAGARVKRTLERLFAEPDYKALENDEDKRDLVQTAINKAKGPVRENMKREMQGLPPMREPREPRIAIRAKRRARVKR